MAYHQDIGEWHGKEMVDRDGERIGKLEDVYVDVESDEPMFGTVKEGLIGRHLTFLPPAGITIGPDDPQVTISGAWSTPPTDGRLRRLTQKCRRGCLGSSESPSDDPAAPAHASDASD